MTCPICTGTAETCTACGGRIAQEWRERAERAEAEVAELKARLKAAGREWRSDGVDGALMGAALDLRRKNWRKP